MQVEIHVLFSAFEHRFNNVLQKDGFSILYICPKVNVDGATFAHYNMPAKRMCSRM
jgi:hypothetical protein